MTKAKKRQPKLSKKQVKWLIIAGALTTIVMVYDFYMADNLRFYANWVKCGQRPVGLRSPGLFNVGARHYIDQPLISGFRDAIDYECTPLEAERAGYSANPEVYDYPHLRAIGEYGKKLGE